MKFWGIELKIADIILGLPQLREYNPKIDQRTRELVRSDDKYNSETLAKIVAALDMLYLLEEDKGEGVTKELSVDKELQKYFEILNLIENIPREALEEPKTETKLPKKYNKYKHIFNKARVEELLLYQLGLDHEIILRPDFKPLWGLIYNLLEEELKVLKEYLEKILRLGIIQRLKSPAVVSLLFVGKKDRGYRLYVDYRRLNSSIILNRYPIPLISEILNRLGEVVVFTKLDLRNVYHLIRIKEGHEQITVFRTRFGLFEYLVLLFSLSNGLVTFQAYINQYLREFINVFMIIYLDNILIYSKEEHLYIEYIYKVLE